MAFGQTPTPVPPQVTALAQQLGQQLAPWFPIFTFVIGQVFAIVLEWLRGIATARRERDARAQARKEAVDDRRAEFQRQTLLGLQDELQHFARLGGRIWAERERTFREHGTWSPALGDELNVESREAYVRLNTLQSRVVDERLRELVEKVKKLQLAHTFGQTQAAANEAFEAMGDAFEEANRRVGELLRELY